MATELTKECAGQSYNKHIHVPKQRFVKNLTPNNIWTEMQKIYQK